MSSRDGKVTFKSLSIASSFRLALLTTIPLSSFPDNVFQSNKVGAVGGKQKHDRQALRDASRLIPFNQKSAHRSLAAKLKIPLSTCHNLLKRERIFKLNDPADVLYCVIQGGLALVGPDGDKKLVGPTQTCGVVEILSGRLRTADATATADTLVLAIEADEDLRWVDAGYVLLWPLALLSLAWFRRGWTVQWG